MKWHREALAEAKANPWPIVSLVLLAAATLASRLDGNAHAYAFLALVFAQGAWIGSMGPNPRLRDAKADVEFWKGTARRWEAMAVEWRTLVEDVARFHGLDPAHLRALATERQRAGKREEN